MTRQEKSRLGICRNCSNAVRPGTTLCEGHANLHKQYFDDKRSKGLCYDCEAPAEIGRVVCRSCADTRNTKRNIKMRMDIEKARLLYGNCCTCCGESQRSFLTFDHVHNDGAEKRRNGDELRVLVHRLANLKVPDPNYQLLCMNCNFSKGLLGECAHQEQRDYLWA